jgi:hypothetical protein
MIDETSASEKNAKWFVQCWDFIREPKNSNALIAVVSALIFLSGAIYTTFSILQYYGARKSRKGNQKSLREGIVGSIVLPNYEPPK